MFGLFKKEETRLEGAIDMVLTDMATYGPDAPEYPSLLEHLEKLHALKMNESRKPVSYDSVALVAGNLLGILIIVAYEQKHVMTSKGLSLLLKTK